METKFTIDIQEMKDLRCNLSKIVREIQEKVDEVNINIKEIFHS
jgi:hypothetical protein